MRVWQISTFGIDSLEFAERPEHQPGPGEAKIKIRSVSFNYRDLMMVKGLYNPKMKLPRIPCSDGAGEVTAVGEGVTRWKPGDRVAGIFMQNWIDGAATPDKTKGALGGDIDGVLAESVILRETGLVAIPAHLSFEEAATLPCAAVTAWNALAAANLKAGATVLVQGTGGVSIFALQFARLMGMRVLGTSSSNEKLERALTLGLHAGVNYRETPEWDRWVMDQTGGEGVDLVVEVGGIGTLPQTLRAVRMGGTIAQIGVLSGPGEQLPLPVILHKQAHIKGIYVGSRHDFEQMNTCIAFADLRPVVEISSWMNVQDVLRKMETGAHFGKLAVTVD
ncbi:MAG: NAD(P)-dependent alcohol dehydrogenase [Terracidiphilus sp.]